MDLDELRVFVAVAEELHFGRAAQRLHIAQPPVSRSIRNLEQSLGVGLFVRTTRSVVITAAGEALLEPAREVLRAADRARHAVDSVISDENGAVRLAFAGASTQALVSDVVSELGRRAPGIRLALTGLAYGARCLELLHEGDTDIVFGRWADTPSWATTELIVRERLILVLPAGHELGQRESLEWGELRGLPLIVLPEDSLLVEILHRLSEEAGFSPLVVQTAPDTATIIALVRAGVGCSVTVSTSIAGVNQEGVVFIPFSPEPDLVELRMAWRAAERSPAVAATVRAVRTVVQRDALSIIPPAAWVASI